MLKIYVKNIIFFIKLQLISIAQYVLYVKNDIMSAYKK